MKIYAEDDKGMKIEINEIKLMGKGSCVIVETKAMLREVDMMAIEQYVAERTGKLVAVLPPYATIKGVI